MDAYGNKLLEFINKSEIKNLRLPLYEKLGANTNQFFVYYITTLQNLKPIFTDGIKCRNNLDGLQGDLSGQNVQSKRKSTNRKLALASKHIKHSGLEKDTHQCINFFLNPLNSTFIAFQRKALFNSFAHKNPNEKPVCILEFPIDLFFDDETINWGVSEKNLASNYFTSFSDKLFSKYNWEKIFSPTKDKEKNTFQSAEFIVFKGNNENSESIPIALINRIIIRQQDQNNFLRELPSLQNKFQANDLLFSDNGYLLFPGKKLLEQIVNMHFSGTVPIKTFLSILNEFKNVCSDLDFFLTPEKFTSTFMAYSYHGIGHTTRVLFWSHFFCSIMKVNKELAQICYYAVLIHDLGKQRDVEDENHSSSSLEKYSALLSEKIKNKANLQICLDAIKYHSIDDDKCPANVKSNVAWQILKDADALERGRFGEPNSKKGCDEKFLRLPIIKTNQQLKSQAMWLAYELATITRYTFWNKDTCNDLINEIKEWVVTYGHFSAINSSQKTIIDEFKKQ